MGIEQFQLILDVAGYGGQGARWIALVWLTKLHFAMAA
jgi:hypothetical protein